MWRMVQEGGFPAMIAVLLGVLGLAAAAGSLVTLAVARRMAFAVGLGALALAFMAAAVGAAGVLLGWHSVDNALAALGSGAEFQRIRIVGYAEARSSGRIGFGAALLPLLAGAAAALLGSRARYTPHSHASAQAARPDLAGYRDAPPSPARPSIVRVAAAAGASLIALFATGAALALGTWPLPENTYGFDVDDGDAWELAAATERSDSAAPDGCERLERALDALRDPLPDRRAMPRRFRRDPAALVSPSLAAATRCAKARFAELAARRGSLAERDILLASSLLVDEELARTIAEYEPPPQRPMLPNESAPAATGRLAPEIIRKVIKTQSSTIRSCYERGLSRDPSLAGRVDVSFTIEPSGEVGNAAIAASTLKDADVESCILGRVRTLTFPKPQGGSVTVKYPFVFEPAR